MIKVYPIKIALFVQTVFFLEIGPVQDHFYILWLVILGVVILGVSTNQMKKNRNFSSQ